MMPNPVDPFAVIPEMPKALSGILQHAKAHKDPVSAAHRFTLRRARDDNTGRAAIERI
jgi:hypothetical protein